MVPIEQLKSLLGDDHGDENELERRPSALYECSACETVYLSEDMQSCPECGSSVRRVPDERELGLIR